MLNGATTRLRRAQAKTSSRTRKRSRPPALSLGLSGAARSLGERRRVGQRMRAACFGPRRPRQAGVAIAGTPIMWRAMAAQDQQLEVKPLAELFAAEPDRLSRLSFDVAGIHFDWSK